MLQDCRGLKHFGIFVRNRRIAMSTISLRLPDSLHKQVRKLAEKESVSINQLITLALAEKLSALMTEEYLEERAKRGSRKKFERAMAKVPKIKPEEYDRLPI
jgi:predicted transcriptional regulator